MLNRINIFGEANYINALLLVLLNKKQSIILRVIMIFINIFYKIYKFFSKYLFFGKI